MEGDRLAEVLTGAGFGPVTEIHHLSGGWETAIWAVHGGGRNLAVRVFTSGRDGATAAAEARVMAILDRLGYPVPRVHHVSESGDGLGAPFLVMDLVDGEAMWSPGRHLGGTDPAVLTGELMAWLHRLDPEAFGTPLEDPIERTCSRIEDVVRTYPGFAPVATWMRREAGRRPPARPVPAHRDLHPGNVLLDRRGRCWVVDWTGFALDDPATDVGWTVLLGEMYADSRFTSAFLDAYETESGRSVLDPVAEVIAATRRLANLLFFMSPEGSAIVHPDARIHQHVGLHRVPAAWIERNTGHRIPEVDALLASD